MVVIQVSSCGSWDSRRVGFACRGRSHFQSFGPLRNSTRQTCPYNGARTACSACLPIANNPGSGARPAIAQESTGRTLASLGELIGNRPPDGKIASTPAELPQYVLN